MGSTPQASASAAAVPTRDELVKKFQILDSVAGVLAMILDGADATTVSSSVAKLHGRFAECEQFLQGLPGGDMSKDEQKAKIASLTASIAQKKALVAKYKDLDVLRRMAAAAAAGSSVPPSAPSSAPPSAGLPEQPPQPMPPPSGDSVFSAPITPRSSTAGLLGDDMFFAALDK